MAFADNLEYLNLNSLRNYPIRDELSRIDSTGQFQIPNDFIVEFSLAASNSPADRFFVSSLYNQLSSFVVEISDANSVVVGSFTIAASSFTEYQTYTMTTANGIYLQANGRLTIGSLDNIKNTPAGYYTFGITATELEPRTITPSLIGVNSITFTDNTGASHTLSGNVNIIARTNLNFTYDSGSNTLTLDAGNGLGLNTNCPAINYITSINGVTPDDSGNISLLALGCVSLSTPAANTLKITDNCCTPCSGCDELAELTSRLTQLESKYLEIKNNITTLEAELNGYLTTTNTNCACP
jgi:hypothetical protein